MARASHSPHHSLGRAHGALVPKAVPVVRHGGDVMREHIDAAVDTLPVPRAEAASRFQHDDAQGVVHLLHRELGHAFHGVRQGVGADRAKARAAVRFGD